MKRSGGTTSGGGGAVGGAGMESIVVVDKRLSWIEQRLLTSFFPFQANSSVAVPRSGPDVRGALEDDEKRREVISFLENTSTKALLCFIANIKVGQSGLLSQNTFTMTTSLQHEGIHSAKKVLVFSRRHSTAAEKISAENIARCVSVSEVSPLQLHAHVLSVLELVHRPLSTAVNTFSNKQQKPLLKTVSAEISKVSQAALVASGCMHGVTVFPSSSLAGVNLNQVGRDTTHHDLHAHHPRSHKAAASALVVSAKEGSYQLHALEQLAGRWNRAMRSFLRAGEPVYVFSSGNPSTARTTDITPPSSPSSPQEGQMGSASNKEVHHRSDIKPLRPLNELRKWQARHRDGGAIVAHLNSNSYQVVYNKLRENGSRYADFLNESAQKCREDYKLIERVTRWLEPLRESFELIDADNPKHAEYSELTKMKTIPKLLQMLGVLWIKNDSYPTSTTMCGLFAGIAECVVEFSTHYLSLDVFFLADPQETTTRLHTVFKVCESLKSSFFRFKTKCDDAGKPWNVPTQQIFAHMDLFLERCNDLLDVLSCRRELDWAAKADVGGMEGVALGQLVGHLSSKFGEELATYAEEALERIHERSDRFDVLTTGGILKTGGNIISRLAHGIVQQLSTAPMSVALVQRVLNFQRTLGMPGVGNQRSHCHTLLWKRWSEEIREVQRVLSLNSESTLVPPQIPSGSRKVLFPLTLYRRLYDVYEIIKKVVALPTVNKDQDELAEAMLLYNAMIQRVSTLFEDSYMDWVKSLEPTMAFLSFPVLQVARNGLYEVVLDETVTNALRDVSVMYSILSEPIVKEQFPHLSFTSTAETLLKMKTTIWQRYSSLLTSTECFNEAISGMEPHERSLLNSEIEVIRKALSPGTDAICWETEDALEELCETVSYLVDSMSTALTALRGFTGGIRKQLARLSSVEFQLVPFVTHRIGDKTLPLRDLWTKYEQICLLRDDLMKQTSESYLSLSGTALAALNASKDQGGFSRISKSSGAWKEHLNHVDGTTVADLKTFVLDTLTNVNNQLDPVWVSKNDGLPMLDAYLVCDGNGLSLSPSLLGEFEELVQQMENDPIDVIQTFPTTEERREAMLKALKEDSSVQVLLGSITHSLSLTNSHTRNFISSLSRFSDLWSVKLMKKLQEELETSKEALIFGVPLPSIKEKITYFQQLGRSIVEIQNSVVLRGWLRIDCRGAKQTLSQKSQDCVQILITHVRERVVGAVRSATQFIRDVKVQFEQNNVLSNDDSEMVRVMFALLREIRTRNETLTQMFSPLSSATRLLLALQAMSREEVDALQNEIDTLEPGWENVYNRSLALREQLRTVQDREVKALALQLSEMTKEISKEREELFVSSVFAHPDLVRQEAYELLDRTRAKWVLKKQSVEKLHELQDLFDVPRTQINEIDETLKDLQTLKLVWDVTFLVETQLEDWMNTPFKDVNSTLLIDESTTFSSLLKVIPREARDWKTFIAADAGVANLLSSLPLVQDLRSPAMRSRHWEAVVRICHGSEVSIDPLSVEFTLRKLLDLHLHSHIDAVTHLVEKAEKEQQIEKQLTHVANFWSSAKLPRGKVDEGGLISPILKSVDGLMETLDEHLNLVQTLQASRWIEYFRDEAQKWQNDLSIVEIALTTWVGAQKKWLSHYPIFKKSADLREQFPEDATAFDDVHLRFMKFLEIAVGGKQSPSIPYICCSKTLLKSFSSQSVEQELQSILETLERCEKGIASYLEIKRRAFARLFFVSDSDLVDMLSKADHPPSVCEHIAKIIISVSRCIFSETNPNREIFAFESVEGETLHLVKPFLCEGKVEDWLRGLIDAMNLAVGKAIIEASNAYADMPRHQWMFNFIAQAVCVVSRVLWTAETATALEAVEDGNLSAMSDHANHLKNQLSSTIAVVLDELDSNQRKALITLITIEVHARDIVQQLSAKKVDSPLSFAWQSQLRFSLDLTPPEVPEEESDEKKKTSDERGGQIGETATLSKSASGAHSHRASTISGPPPETYAIPKAQILDTAFVHGREYNGNCGTLVVTPLTDRCYITLTQALKLFKGGAPAGPAGTGKTETVKDVAHALGIPVYVFNCSEQMDYLTVANIYKGLAMSGAWGCFDEFNRISAEVLSVVAAQVKAVLDARRRRADTFYILGEELPLVDSIGIFVTMNPGYKGRTELPENVKALFRPCAMVVPDIGNICEIMLSAEGFVTAKELALKFVKLYQLNSELLSPQSHYDWGLRAVRAVLFIAGSLKRKYPDVDEKSILMRALRESNLAKLDKSDMPMFLRLISALFPGVKDAGSSSEEVELIIRQSAINDNYYLGEGNIVLTKTLQLFDLLDVRHSIFILGPGGSGKTTLLSIAQKSLQAIHKCRVITETLDPKAVSSHELYGYVQPQTREWKDGVLSRVFRDFASQPRFKNSKQWIVLDGNIDADWIESMNSVMDDNKLLTLANNERIIMSPRMRLLFEIADLNSATPATVSRAGIVFLNDSDVGWAPSKDRWIALRSNEKEKAQLDILFDKYIGKFLEYLTTSQKTVVPMSVIACVRNLCRFLDGVLARDDFKNIGSDVFEKVFVWGCIWAFGSPTQHQQGVSDYRLMFSTMVRRQFQHLKIPEEGLAFDYRLEVVRDPAGVTTGQWVKWQYDPKSWHYDSQVPLDRALVPNIDLTRYHFMLETLVVKGSPVLFVGPAGCGKSQIIKAFVTHCETLSEQPSSGASSPIAGSLGSTLSPTEHLGGYQSMTVHFHANVTAEVLQADMETRLEKRIGHNYGPIGFKKMIVILENVNIPRPDKYGTQSAHALIRQHMDHRFWYDRAKLTAKTVEDVQFLGTMCPANGSQQVHPRFLQKFFILGLGFMTNQRITEAFTTYLHTSMKSKGVKAAILSMLDVCVAGIVELWETVSKKFLPTAETFHYSFTMRDIARMCQGLIIIDAKTRVDKFPSLWVHEAHRVFADRLVTEDDLEEVSGLILSKARGIFSSQPGSELLDTEVLFYPVSEAFVQTPPTGGGSRHNSIVDVAPGETTTMMDGSSLFGPDYHMALSVLEVADFIKSEFQRQDKDLSNIVLFDEAVENVAKVMRLMVTPNGHGLLVGVSGSGKQTVVRLASSLQGYHVMSVKSSGSVTAVADFRADLGQAMMKCALKSNRICLCVNESDVAGSANVGMLELLDLYLQADYLQSDIFNSDDLGDIQTKMALELKSEGEADFSNTEKCMSRFWRKVSQTFRIMFCAGSTTQKLKAVMRRFAGLSKAQLVYFHRWSSTALASVARMFLNSGKTPCTFVSEEVASDVCEFIASAYSSTMDQARLSRVETKRTIHITPMNFLSFVSLTHKLLLERRGDINTKFERMTTGLEKLDDCNVRVKQLQIDLKQFKVAVHDKARDTQILLERVESERDVVSDQNALARHEEATTDRIVTEVNNLVASCEATLEAAQPMVKMARGALDTLDKNNLTELKSMSKPPEDVREVVGCVMCLIARPDRIPRDRSWAAARRMMANVTTWMNEMKNLDENNIPQPCIDAIMKNVQQPHFNPDVIKSKSFAASSLCRWVVNMVKFHEVRITVIPKELALAESRGRLAVSQNQLRRVKEKVADLQSKLTVIEGQLDEATTQKKNLEAQLVLTEKKLERAQRLIVSLSGEKVRWGSALEDIEKEKEVVDGDSLFGAAFAAFCGPFSFEMRERLQMSWLEHLKKLGIPTTKQVDSLTILADELRLAQWAREGIPAAAFTFQNAAISATTNRWPLLIDPQEQGLKWIQGKCKLNHKELVTLRQTEKNFYRKLMHSMANGHHVVVFNAQVDGALAAFATKNYTVVGTQRKLIVGDHETIVDPGFELVLHNASANPLLSPESFSHLSVINFCVTETGIQEQLLSRVVSLEKPQLEQQRLELMDQINEMTIRIHECEKTLLRELSSASGDILENETLVDSLEGAKLMSIELGDALVEANTTRMKISAACDLYSPIATRAAIMYMATIDLCKVDSMYHYSIELFQNQYEAALRKAKTQITAGTQNPVDIFVREITKQIYGFVHRSLFTPHKVLFASAVAFRVLLRSGDIDPVHLDFFVRGQLKQVPPPPGHVADWLQPPQWSALHALADLEGSTPPFRNIIEECLETGRWRQWSELPRPEQERMPGDWKMLTPFQRVMVIKCFRPDRVVAALQILISECVGKFFFDDFGLPATELAESVAAHTPLMFILSSGYDPGRELEEAADKAGITGSHSSTKRRQTMMKESCNALGEMEKTMSLVTVDISIEEQVDFPPQLWVVSMGQGQESEAEKAMEVASRNGGWVFLQNVHLMKRWMPILEQVVQELSSKVIVRGTFKIPVVEDQPTPDKKAATTTPSQSHLMSPNLAALQLVRTPTPPMEEEERVEYDPPKAVQSGELHPNFRLFLSSEAVDTIPSNLIQRCVKVVNEAPTGLRSNFVRAYGLFSGEPWEQSTKPQEYHSLVYSLSYFHAVIVERDKFGRAGWNRRYPFNHEDLLACTDVLSAYLEDRPRVPWEDLRYVFGEIMYGGHITDAWDKRLCMTYLDVLVSQDALERSELVEGVPFPPSRSFTETMSHIAENFPEETPGLFLMNACSETSTRTVMARELFSSLLDVIPVGKAGSSGENVQDRLLDVVVMLMGAVPETIPMSDTEDRLGDERTPYQHVFFQECGRLNRLSDQMRASLDEAEAALKGTAVLTSEVESLLEDLTMDRVPQSWRALWGHTKRPLSSWTSLVQECSNQLSNWAIDLLTPKFVSLHCFFIPIAFLTAILQDTALRTGKELDQMGFIVDVTKKQPNQVDIHAREGCYIWGPALEGASWDVSSMCLQDAQLRDGVKLPVMTIRAGLVSKVERRDTYACPMYHTTDRHQTYIATLHLRTRVPADRWTLRGTALILDNAF